MTFMNVATAVCIGLMIGTEFAVSAFINPILSKLDHRAHTQATRMFGATLGRVMPFWYSLGMVLLLIDTVAARREPGVLLLAIASGIWALVIVLTLMFLVPINNRLVRSEGQEFSAENVRAHRRWDVLHRFRVAALTAAMILFLVSVR